MSSVQKPRLVSGRLLISSFIAFGVVLPAAIPFVAQAQENGIRAGHPCTSPVMLRLLSRQGDVIRVSSAEDPALSLSREESQQGSAAGQVPDSFTTLRHAYDRFAKLARDGDPHAQVNLAVASLAGWGTAANSGAALYWLDEAARQAYPLAYFDLGIVYQNGCGVRQDYSEAARYFQRGADLGDASSQMNLGYFYDQGLGVARDRKQAAVWYRKAAESGVAQAQFNLADLYLRGEGVSPDQAMAFTWFQKAALQGDTEAQIMLGLMCAQGRGTAQDLLAAYMWLSAAGLRGDSRAASHLASLERQLSEAQIAEAQSRAHSLVESFARSSQLSSESALLR